MIRYIRYIFLAAVAIVLVTVAIANRGSVSLRLLPEELGHFAGLTAQIQLPLFVVIYGGIVAGLLIGFFWEWIREHKHRAEATRAKREVSKLEREVTRLKGDRKSGEDEVLALLE